MLAVFRVDAGAKIGVGHLMRCHALAQALEENHADILFIMRAEARDVALARHDWVGRIVTIPESINMADESNWIRDYLYDSPVAEQLATQNQKTSIILILDGYQFSSHYRQQLKQSISVPLVLFDDSNDSGLLYADVVINSATSAFELNYRDTAPLAELCLGEDYRVLRKEFRYLPDIPWSQKQSLTLVFGGSDVANLTINTLQVLQNMAWQSPVRVLTGAAYQPLAALSETIQGCDFAVQHLPNCQDVADVFCHSKLVVSAAGSSQFELHACVTPSILVTVADNQIGATQVAVQQKWCQVLDMRQIAERDAEQQLAEITKLGQLINELWHDETQLRQMREAAVKSKPVSDGEALLDVLFQL